MTILGDNKPRRSSVKRQEMGRVAAETAFLFLWAANCFFVAVGCGVFLMFLERLR